METGSLVCTCLLILIISVSSSYGQANYSIDAVSVSNGSNTPVEVGSSNTVTVMCTVMLTCTANCTDDTLNIMWTLDGNAINTSLLTVSSGSPYAITNDDDIMSTLTTSGNIAIGHAGLYNCTASLTNSATNSSDTGAIYVQVSQTTNVSITGDTSVSAGTNSHTFTCDPTHPNGLTPSYRWTKGSDNSVTSQNYTISTVSISSAGTYTCTVTVSHGNSYVIIQNPTASQTATLTVTIPTPSDVTVTNNGPIVVGNTANITCTVTLPSFGSYNSDTSVSVTWNDTDLSSQTVTAMATTTVTAQIANINVTHAGGYTCTAGVIYTGNSYSHVTNSGTDSGSTTLTVNVPTPTSVSVNSVTVTAGGTASITCTVTLPSLNYGSNTFVSITWNDTVLSSLTLPAMSSTVGTSNITNVNVGHAGGYNCTASVFYNGTSTPVTNSSTNSGSNTLRVTVNDQITVTTPKNQLITIGDANRTLNCSSSTPTGLQSTHLSYRWTGPVSVMGSQVSTSSPGTYTCTVSVTYQSPFVTITNPNNTKDTVLYVTSVGVSPMTVTRLDVSPYDNFTITCTVTVNPSTGSPVYTFTWEPNDGYLRDSGSGNSNSTTFSGLSSGGYTYTCRPSVTVPNADGTGMPTAATSVTIKGSSPPVKPVVLGQVTVTPNTATIRWTVPSVSYTPENYTVMYERNGTGLTLSSTVTYTTINEDLTFITATNTSYSVQLTGLNVSNRYCYKVVATNSISSTESEEDCFTTQETVPHAPSNITLRTLSSTSLLLSWGSPSPYTGDIIDYNYTCTGVNTSMSYTSSDTMSGFLNTSVRLTGLEPFREYTCNVSAATSVGPGPAGNDSALTGEAAPSGPPLSFNATSPTPSTISLSWTLPDIQLTNGIIISYTYYCTGATSTNNLTVGTITGTSIDDVTFTDIKPYTNYTCYVSASNSVGRGPAANVSVTTAQDRPGVVNSLIVSPASDTSFTISWARPTVSNGIITNYTVIIRSYETNAIVNTSVTSDMSIVIGGLTGEVPYIIFVDAATIAGRGMIVNTTNFTKEGVAGPVQNVNFTRISDTAATITWTPLTLIEAKGFVSNYNITLTPTSSSRRKRQGGGMILTQLVPYTQSSVVFNNLVPEESYNVTVQAVNGQGGGMVSPPITVPPGVTPTTSSPSSLSSGAAAAIGVIMAILLVAIIIVIVVLVLFYLRRRRSKGELTVHTNMGVLDQESKGANGKGELELVTVTSKPSDGDNNNDRSGLWVPVPVTEFAAHTNELHDNRDLGFEEEYKTFKGMPQGSYMASKLPHNIPKNRFDNVYPYDASRVELTPLPDAPGTDYINASYIDGYRRPKAYIAAQGPLPATVGDFWRMVWEFQLPTVVMLTELVERGIEKCTCYWPRGLNETINVGYDLKVTLVEQQQYVDYKLKKFLLLNTSSDGGGRLDVTHYHFLAWPDHGVPADKTIMLSFIRRVRQSHPFEGPPLIVHCSAGVGRTGTFITLDSMMQRLIAKEDTLNVYEFLADMRSKRVLMVQTEAQYVYIHDALTEYITCGDTSMTAKSLQSCIDELSKVSEHKSGYQKQLELLNKVSRQPSDGLCTDALVSRNTNKNRYPNRLETLPYDMTRVRLKTASGDGDYINANHVDGYKHRGAFLATQAPLDNTAEDLWRMVWEQWSSSVIMLCNLEENETKVSTQYWPVKVDDKVTYGKMIVKLLSEEQRPHYIVRKISLSQESTYINVTAGAADHLTVTQYHYLNWPEDGMPKDETPLLKMIDQLLHNQMNTGNKAITVMCSDGVGRTGAFMCVYSVLERLKIEGVADIFQYIKGARFNRPGLVQNKEQYEFCFNVVLEYLNSFDAYHNF